MPTKIQTAGVLPMSYKHHEIGFSYSRGLYLQESGIQVLKVVIHRLVFDIIEQLVHARLVVMGVVVVADEPVQLLAHPFVGWPAPPPLLLHLGILLGHAQQLLVRGIGVGARRLYVRLHLFDHPVGDREANQLTWTEKKSIHNDEANLGTNIPI